MKAYEPVQLLSLPSNLPTLVPLPLSVPTASLQPVPIPILAAVLLEPGDGTAENTIPRQAAADYRSRRLTEEFQMATLIRIVSLLLLAILGLALTPFSVAGSTLAGNDPQSNALLASSSTPDGSVAPSNAIRGSIGTTLVKGLDSKKLKEGDQVVCQTAGTIRSKGVLISAGAKITGHVTRATARSKGDSNSSLSIEFDKIEISKGREVPMKGTLQAVGPNLTSQEPQRPDGMWESPTGSNAPPMKTVGNSSNEVPEAARPMLNAEAAGVLGVRDITLDKDSVLISNGKEVKLVEGTQLLIRAEILLP